MSTVKPMAGGVRMMSAGSGSTQVMSRAPASTSMWVMRRKAVGSGQLLQLDDQFLQLGAARLGDRQLRRRGTEHEPLHRVRLAVGGELGVLLGRVRALTVEAASDVGFDLHPGALVGHFGHERAIEHRKLGPSRLDDDASSVVAMTLPSKGFGSM